MAPIARPRRRRTTRIAFVPVLALALLTVATSCGRPSPTESAHPATTVAIPAARGCLPAGESSASTAGPYAVGRAEVTFVDATRPTEAKPDRHLESRPDRALPTVILYPASTGDPTGPATAGAPPADGAFPLIIASHGVTSTGAAMAALVEPWVRAGYIVAAPSFPLGSGPGANISDLPNQPGDVNFVVASMRKLADDPAQALGGHLAPDCLALAGHSLGAATTLEATFESTYRVTSVQAAIAMSGVLAPIPGGSFADPPAVPLLLVHGAKDPVVSISGSQTAFARLPGPNYFVTFPDADHNSIFAPPNKALLDQAAIAFLDAELKGGPPASDQLSALLARYDIASLQTKES